MPAYRARVQNAHNLPYMEVPTRGPKMKCVKAVPYRQILLHWERLVSAAPRPGQQHVQVELLIRFNFNVKIK